MTIQRVAEILNGRQYRSELAGAEEKLFEKEGLVIVFGASDDLLEFRGAIHEELGAWDGTNAYIIKKKGQWEAISEEEHEGITEQLEDLGMEIKSHKIEAAWAPTIDGNEYSWHIRTAIPHEIFDIMEDEDYYCRGIIFNINDL